MLGSIPATNRFIHTFTLANLLTATVSTGTT